MIDEIKIGWIAGEYHHSVYAINKEFSLYSKHLILNPVNVKWFLYELTDYLDL
jgi:hypothetical protein